MNEGGIYKSLNSSIRQLIEFLCAAHSIPPTLSSLLAGLPSPFGRSPVASCSIFVRSLESLPSALLQLENL
ncbi:hypothetical protein RJT34_14764 [Clitoria ternatea]|uniref:Uncharacterized protein n=1 Tax=Clitoria ternatea TaxID=43366 RepID=A0AAN9JTV6_CLITE